MNDPILQTERPILLIGAGPMAGGALQSIAPFCGAVAALDGGIARARAADMPVDLHLGDMDSSTPDAAVRSIELPDQSHNDFTKALRVLKAPLIIAAGCLGGRIDHQLANFSGITAHDAPVVLVDENTCVFAVPANQEINLPIPAGSDVAFYPLRPVWADIRGTKWEVAGAKMAPDGLISTSNIMQADMLHMRVDGAGFLAILPMGSLEAIVNWAQP